MASMIWGLLWGWIEKYTSKEGRKNMGSNDLNFSDTFAKMEEERKIAQAELEFHYADRRKEKLEKRAMIERTAERICAAVNGALDKENSPDELAALSAALCSAATALQITENYAESMPITNYRSSLACCSL